MMKILKFYAPLIALASVVQACSSDEGVNPEKSTNNESDVYFTATVDDVKDGSRGAVVGLSELVESGFWVKAVKADGVSYPWGVTGTLKFSSTDNGSSFNAKVEAGSSFTASWPTGQLLYFFATNVDPAENSMTLNFPPKLKINPDHYVSNHKDVVYATNTGTRADFASTNGRVALEFKHALVQIEIKAKNTNKAYTVKVKGYRIYGLWDFFTFTYPNVTTPNTTSGTITWNSTNDVGNNGGVPAYYYSGWKNGFKTTEVNNGLSDTSEDNYILLGDEEQTINNGEDSGLAMVVPRGKQQWSSSGALGGFAIELLVQIDYNDLNNTPLYPACQRGSLTKRISYSGLPKYYGYVHVPYYTDRDTHINLANCAGKKITFLLDFSNGLGYVDNIGLLERMQGTTAPVTVDASDSSTYNAEDGTGNTGGTDPYSFNSKVLGSGCSISASVGAWTAETPNRDPVVQ